MRVVSEASQKLVQREEVEEAEEVEEVATAIGPVAAASLLAGHRHHRRCLRRCCPNVGQPQIRWRCSRESGENA